MTARAFDRLKAKAKAAERLGYKYRVVVAHRDNVCVLPKNWTSMSAESVGEFIYDSIG